MVEQQKYYIFIVEDDADLSEMLAAYFRTQGYRVEQAFRGGEAVQMITSNVPDLVLLDIRLPDIDGYEVCRRIRKIRRLQNLPVVFLTEKRDREDKLSGLELGAVDYITKPFDMQELLLRVRNVLRRTQTPTALNPITHLPTGRIVRERLAHALEAPDWGIVLIHLARLIEFREKYSFVAADDVARAVALIIKNSTTDMGCESCFVGHVNNSDYVVVTTAVYHKKLAQYCESRLQPAIPYFYPATERQHIHDLPDSQRLAIQVVTLSAHDRQVSDVVELFHILDNLN